MSLTVGFDKLPIREQIKAFYKWGFSYVEIGDYFGISKQRVFAIINDTYLKNKYKRMKLIYREFWQRW